MGTKHKKSGNIKRIRKSTGIKHASHPSNKPKSMRPYGDILLDLETLYNEMIDDHEVQFADLIGHLDYHVKVHRPDCIEIYEEDGSSPELKYGPKEESE